MESSEYTLGLTEYTDDLDEYSVVYYYYVNGIKTEDFVLGIADNCGNIVSVAFPHKDAFTGVELKGVTADNVYTLFNDQIAKMLGRECFSVFDCILRKDDNQKCFLEFTIEYSTEDKYKVKDTVNIYLEN